MHVQARSCQAHAQQQQQQQAGRGPVLDPLQLRHSATCFLATAGGSAEAWQAAQRCVQG